MAAKRKTIKTIGYSDLIGQNFLDFLVEFLPGFWSSRLFGCVSENDWCIRNSLLFYISEFYPKHCTFTDKLGGGGSIPFCLFTSIIFPCACVYERKKTIFM